MNISWQEAMSMPYEAVLKDMEMLDLEAEFSDTPLPQPTQDETMVE